MGNFTCDCSCDVDGNEVYESSIRMARKEHTCCECHEKIKPKKKYEYVSLLNEGEWSHYKTCMRCLALRNKHCSGGWYFGDLFSTLRDCMNWDPRTEFFHNGQN